MTVLLDTAMASVLANYADVIEGGNTWRGSGTVYNGIPGRYSSDQGLLSGDDATLTVSAAVDTTHFGISAPSTAWRANRWTPSKGPAFWVLGATGTLVGKHRKITGYTTTNERFTVAPAFSAAPQVADTFTVLQGFKRLPNTEDMDTAASDGFDRCFHLSALAGRPLSWTGNSTITYETELKLRLRILKFGRLHDWTAAAMNNLAIIRPALVRREHLPSTYVVALSPMGFGSSIAKDDKDKIVVVDTYRLIYRVSQEFT